MTFTNFRRIFYICLLLVPAYCLYFIASRFTQPHHEWNQQHRVSQFLVNTVGCKIPYLDPYDDTVRHMVSRLPPIQCDSRPPMTFVDKDFLRINRTAIELYYNDDFGYCVFQPILRPPSESDYIFKYGDLVRVEVDTKMTDRFVRIVCKNKASSMVYVNFHAFIFSDSNRDLELLKLFTDHKSTKHLTDTYNIIMVGVDSISRLNFIRQLPETRRYLVDKLGAVELQGYNKVADNTFVNLVPMLAGKFVDELPWDDVMADESFDKFPFIWKEFSSRGYETLFAEDAPSIAIFNYDKPGFNNPPTDHYLRPLSLAMEDHRSIWKNDHDCVGSTLETNVVLDYLLNFISKERHVPYWAFAFITRLTHDNIHKASLADAAYHNFMRSLHLGGHLKNSILIFYSDHGMRFGEIRETYIGKLEERLPFMYVVTPSSFKNSYPEYFSSLQTNAHRLTTPFDIYETLRGLLDFDGRIRLNNKKSRCLNLFRNIPEERTCVDAAIGPHWCTCHEYQTIDVHDEDVVKASSQVIAQINRELKRHHGKCATLILDKVTDARAIKINSQVFERRKTVYQPKDDLNETSTVQFLLTIQTRPGEGLFEATVHFSRTSKPYRVSGDISRINRYGDQSMCVDYHKHKKFCFCV